jgi:hypothetical protein
MTAIRSGSIRGSRASSDSAREASTIDASESSREWSDDIAAGKCIETEGGDAVQIITLAQASTLPPPQHEDDCGQRPPASRFL